MSKWRATNPLRETQGRPRRIFVEARLAARANCRSGPAMNIILSICADRRHFIDGSQRTGGPIWNQPMVLAEFSGLTAQKAGWLPAITWRSKFNGQAIPHDRAATSN